MGDKIALHRECWFPNYTKSMMNKVTLFGFRGRRSAPGACYTDYAAIESLTRMMWDCIG